MRLSAAGLVKIRLVHTFLPLLPIAVLCTQVSSVWSLQFITLRIMLDLVEGFGSNILLPFAHEINATYSVFHINVLF